MRKGMVGWFICLAAGLTIWMSSARAEDAPPSAEKVAAALAKVDSALLQGKTQDEIKSELPVSKSYRDETTPKAEEVTLDSGETVTIYRYLSDMEIFQYRGDVLWTCIAAFLVFLMQAGFLCVEVGFTQAKNSVNIVMKNILDFCCGTCAYLIIGYHLMFGGDSESLIFLGKTDMTDWGFAFWLFQCVFAATTATIVSGAMAERTKFTSYLLYSVLVSAFIYPIYGSWAWGSLLDGGGWLEAKGFYDFAGSTVVHSIGGWIALAGAIVLGPRIGKFGKDGKPRAFPGHNLPLAALGALLLWFGWFGFNPGSTTTFDGNLARIAVMTNIAGATGGIGALITVWILTKKPDASMTINGFLAGMVAICSAVNVIDCAGSFAVGLAAGVLVVLSVFFIENVLKIDDPVGAVSVHGVGGAWGTLAYAFFADLGDKTMGDALVSQLWGIGTGFVWAFGCGMAMFLIIKYTVGLRVHADEELKGLDITEHGAEGYYGFQIFTTK